MLNWDVHVGGFGLIYTGWIWYWFMEDTDPKQDLIQFVLYE